MLVKVEAHRDMSKADVRKEVRLILSGGSVPGRMELKAVVSTGKVRPDTLAPNVRLFTDNKEAQ
jgi:hypothetical protein